MCKKLFVVHRVGVRQDTVADHRAPEIGDVAEGRWIAEDDRRRDATDVDRLTAVDAARRTDGIDRAGTIDLPHATDRVGVSAPEIGEIRIVDLDQRIVDRDPGIRGHRWIARETGNDLPIIRRIPGIRQGKAEKRMRKLKDRPIQEREKNCEMAGLSRVARKVARVVPLAMRTSRLGK